MLALSICSNHVNKSVSPSGANMNRKIKDQFILHVIVLIWGYTGIIGKWSTLDPDQLVFLRMGAAFSFCRCSSERNYCKCRYYLP